MLKKFSFQLDEHQAKQFFSPIRNKEQIINLLMRSIKVMLIDERLETETEYEMVLTVSKMSRLFYYSKDKYFSINFPFTVVEKEEKIKFSFKNYFDIDHKVTSDVISILTQHQKEQFNEYCIFDFIDPITNVMEFNDTFWLFFRELLSFEDGYIRYDHDEDHVNGEIHPLDHYDVFYQSNNTFKIGLRKRSRKESIIDLLETESKCHYLEIETK